MSISTEKMHCPREHKKAVLAKSAPQLNSTLVLKDKLDEFGPNFIAHMTISRVLRYKNIKSSEQQPMKGNNLLKLISGFTTIRYKFQRTIPAGWTMKIKSRYAPFKAEQIDLTSGLRANRKILVIIKSENNR